MWTNAKLVYIRFFQMEESVMSTLQDSEQRNTENIVDDKGTGQDKAVSILRNLRDHGFAASNEQLATALGRSADQVEGWLNGTEEIDDDVIMKARGIARERDVEIETDSDA